MRANQRGKTMSADQPVERVTSAARKSTYWWIGRVWETGGLKP